MKVFRDLLGLLLVCVCVSATMKAEYQRKDAPVPPTKKEQSDIAKLTKAGYRGTEAQAIVKQAPEAGGVTVRKALSQAPVITKDVAIAKVKETGATTFAKIQEGIKKFMGKFASTQQTPPKLVAMPETPNKRIEETDPKTAKKDANNEAETKRRSDEVTATTVKTDLAKMINPIKEATERAKELDAQIKKAANIDATTLKTQIQENEAEIIRLTPQTNALTAKFDEDAKQKRTGGFLLDWDKIKEKYNKDPEILQLRDAQATQRKLANQQQQLNGADAARKELATIKEKIAALTTAVKEFVGRLKPTDIEALKDDVATKRAALVEIENKMKENETLIEAEIGKIPGIEATKKPNFMLQALDRDGQKIMENIRKIYEKYNGKLETEAKKLKSAIQESEAALKTITTDQDKRKVAEEAAKKQAAEVEKEQDKLLGLMGRMEMAVDALKKATDKGIALEKKLEEIIKMLTTTVVGQEPLDLDKKMQEGAAIQKDLQDNNSSKKQISQSIADLTGEIARSQTKIKEMRAETTTP